MAKRPRGRLEEKCFEGEERRKAGRVVRVANREDDDWGRKMWRWVKESKTRDEISGSGNAEEVEPIEEM